MLKRGATALTLAGGLVKILMEQYPPKKVNDSMVQKGAANVMAVGSLPDREATTPSTLTTLQSEIATLRARLDSLERLLQLRDAAHGLAPAPLADTPALPAFFEIAADELLPVQDGFYQLEWGPEGAFRWTGPGPEVHFEAWIDRSRPLAVTLRLFHFGMAQNAQDLMLDVDGTTYPLFRKGDDKILHAAPIAPRPTVGPTALTLRVSHPHCPADQGRPDKRLLGVAFQRLRLDRA